MVQAFTVYYGLVSLGDVRKGSTVLIHSAAGGCVRVDPAVAALRRGCRVGYSRVQ
jgi:NADPH:quinone reductase-like Zn-dependent oxidoreductase